MAKIMDPILPILSILGYWAIILEVQVEVDSQSSPRHKLKPMKADHELVWGPLMVRGTSRCIPRKYVRPEHGRSRGSKNWEIPTITGLNVDPKLQGSDYLEDQLT